MPIATIDCRKPIPKYAKVSNVITLKSLYLIRHGIDILGKF